MLRVIKKIRIHEEVVTQIHELIREGRLKAGDQLPSERELADTFQVSRASVREALRALETNGQATQNHANDKLVSGLLDVLSHSREESLQTAGRRQASIDSHLAILAAIEKHDEAKAREAMRYHIEQVEQNVLLSKKEKSAIGYPRRQIDASVDLPLNKPEV